VACGSRTQTFDSQVAANDDVAASVRLQLESIGVRNLQLWQGAGCGQLLVDARKSSFQPAFFSDDCRRVDVRDRQQDRRRRFAGQKCPYCGRKSTGDRNGVFRVTGQQEPAKPRTITQEPSAGLPLLICLPHGERLSPTRFPPGKQIGTYVGMIPSEDSSAGKQRLGHINKRGNSLFRFLLVEAASAAARINPDWRRRYLHLAMRRHKSIAKALSLLTIPLPHHNRHNRNAS